MTTTWGPIVYPAALDGFAPSLIDNVDEVIANHPNSLATAIRALETKLGITNNPVTGLGGISFDPAGKAANPGAPGTPTIWADNSGGPGFTLYYTDDLGSTYDITAGGVTIQDWAPATVYAVDQEVVYVGLRFRCLSAHTSGGTFFNDTDMSKWTCVSGEGFIVNQAGHGFTELDVIYSAAGVWTLADASSSATLPDPPVVIIGVGTAVNYFLAAQDQIVTVTLHGLVVDDIYYLSTTVPGQLTNTAPTGAGEYVCPIVRILSTNTLAVLPYRSVSTDVLATPTLDLAYDGGLSGSGAGRSITADSGAVAITVPDTSNNAGLEITQNDVTNDPVAMTITNAGDGSSLTISNAGTGASINLAGAGSRLITSDNASLTISTTTAGDIDINSFATVDIDGVTVEIDASGGFAIAGVTASSISAGAADLSLQGYAVATSFNDAVNTGLVGFTATTVMGALNELRSDLTAEDLWDRAGTTLSPHTAGDNVDLTGTLGTLHSYTQATPYAQVVTVAKSGGDFTTIQGAITSIVDATTSKRYVVKVQSGVYTETITLKDYVDVIGAGRTNTIIAGTSGTVLTFPANKCTVSEVGVSVNYGTLGANSVAIASACVDAVLKDCDITVTKSAGDYTMTAISATSGSFRMSDCYFNYSDTSAATASSLDQKVVVQDGTLTDVILNNNEMIMTTTDTNDNLIGFYSAATVTGTCLLVNNIVNIDASSAASSVTGVWLDATATGAVLSQNRIVVNCDSSAYGLWIDSSAGGAIVDTRHNEFIVTSVGAAQGGSVAVGDTWNSAFDKITATTPYTGAGSINIVSSGAAGTLETTGAITVGGDITTVQAIGRDTDNEIAWTTDDQLDITIGGSTTQIASISTGGAGDDDKLVTQGYVDVAVATVDTWSEILALGNTSGGTNPTISKNDTIDFLGATSGTISLAPTAIAGTNTLTLPAATDTLVGKATGDVFTNKSISFTTNTISGTAAEFDTACSDDNFAFVSDNLSVFAATTSLQLAGVISDETGSGALVFGTSPALTTPTGIIASDIGMSEIGTATYDDVQDWSNTTQSAGVISGGVITDGGSGTINISAITGILKTTNSEVGANVFFDFGPVVGQVLTDDATNYIVLDYNGGSPQLSVGLTNTANGHDIITIGTVFREGDTLDIIDSATELHTLARRVQRRFLEGNFLQFISGGVVTETGTRNLDITSGIIYFGLNRLTSDEVDTSLSHTITGGGSGGTISANDTIVLDSGEGNVTANYVIGNSILIESSSNGNDGHYHVESSSWDGTNTTVVIHETTLNTGADTGSVRPNTFEYYYYNGAAWVETNATQIDNTYYNNVASGLVELGVAKYGVHWVYKGTNGSTYVLYGQGSYLLSEAQSAQPPSSVPEHVSGFGVLRAKIIILKSAAAFTEIASVVDTTFTTTTPSLHNELGGIQGGAAGDYYHLTLAQHTSLTGGVTYDASSLHRHSLDSDYDSSGSGVGRSITADSGAVAITVSNSSNNAALELIQNDVANNPTVLSITNAGTGADITLVAGGTIATSGNGDLIFTPHGTGITAVGANNTSHLLSGPNDLFVNGILEVDGAVYFDDALTVAGNSSLASNVTFSGTIQIGGSTAANAAFMTRVNDDGLHIGIGMADGYTNGNVIICNNAYIASDYDHETPSVNPTLIIHSATDPDSDNTQWGSLAHNQTDFVISTGKGKIQLLPVAGSITQIGAGTPGNLGTPTNNDAYVGGRLEVDGAVYIDNVLRLDGGVEINCTDGSSAYGAIILRDTYQTVDSPLLIAGTTSNSWILAGNAAVAANFDFAHAKPDDPTLFGHSISQSTTEWWSLTHNQTDAVISTGKGKILLLPVAGSLTQIGDAIGPQQLTVPTNDDLFVSNKFEAYGNSYFDQDIYCYSDIFMAGSSSRIGSSSFSTDGGMICNNANQTIQPTWFVTGTAGNHYLFCEYDDRSFNFSHTQQTNPTIYLHSANQATDEWLSFTHNQTDAVISTGKGKINLLPVAGSITQIGDAGSTTHTLNTNDDLLVTGRLEVDGIMHHDSTAFFHGIAYYNAALQFSSDATYYGGMIQGVDDGLRLFVGAAENISNRNLIITDSANRSVDHNHNTLSANPTLFGHSVTSPASDDTQWWSLTHDQTDFVQGIGTGSKVTEHEAPVSLADEGYFDLPDASAGFGFFSIGDGEEWAQVSWTSAGVVTLVHNSTNVDNAYTNGYFCIYNNGGTQVRVRNRLGATKTVMFDYNFTTSP